ncbi:Unconventional myosin-Va [Madurella mycetomatis]|uniref:Unconventional myosin-Va n=1 Tax=Madurella mycetomatis TaxID=100816 RepID=A0A175W7S6_9PEZI|nr:Unconventional myosin-Va [Madurella mycetomatis]KXX79559.1 Unconventional myosin-Va [Madurella mycetomatis]
MVGLYEGDPFAAYDGSEFSAFLAQQQQRHPDSADPFAGSSPEDFHVTSATEPHFPPATFQHHHNPGTKTSAPPAYLSQPSLHDFQPAADPLSGYSRNNPDLTAVAAANATATSQPFPWDLSHPDLAAAAAAADEALPLDTATARSLITALQTSLRQTSLERDEARMQLSTARNELYAARQVGKRLRTERDEARSQVEFLTHERQKVRETEKRLRKERNEARLALLMKGNGGNNTNKRRGGAGAAGDGQQQQMMMTMGAAVGVESQGEESMGESPPLGRGRGRIRGS